MKTIALTGGPCGGKTQALGVIRERFERFGYNVVIVQEGATELISSGVPANAPEFQKLLAALQLKNEAEAFRTALKKEKNGKESIVICDRGLPDGKAYCSPVIFDTILENLGLTEAQMMSRYDAVFHLRTTAAGGSGTVYSHDTNPCRWENAREAVEKDRKVQEAWSSHPALNLIENCGRWEEKAENLIRRIIEAVRENPETELIAC